MRGAPIRFVAHATSGWADVDIEQVAGRLMPDVYRVSGKADLYAFILNAVEASGGRVLYASEANRAPIYLGVQVDSDERIGMLIYPFRITRNRIRNRPEDEVRGQLRYGSESTWNEIHRVGSDIAGVDVSLVLGIDTKDQIAVGLDASLWDPLPMGISFYAKSSEIDKAMRTGWHVWEKENRGGTRRSSPRSPTKFETVVAFRPERFIDFARLERRATSLRLDPPLRHAAAISMTQRGAPVAEARHVLEEQFALSSEQILDIIGGRNRLTVAVRGGVAEHHLESQLNANPAFAKVERLDADAMHDFNVTFKSGRVLRIECKNASPKTSANGDFKVEVQKTRSSKGDPASRFYSVDAFDAVAACLFSATGHWEFRFGRTSAMPRHKAFPDRLAAIQPVNEEWISDIEEL